MKKVSATKLRLDPIQQKILKSERSIFDEVYQVEEGVMQASRLMRLGLRSQKEVGRSQIIKQMLIKFV